MEPTRQSFAPSPFRPAWWLPGGHLQTLGGRFLRRRISYSYERESLETPDDDRLSLDYDQSRRFFEENNRGHVLLLHGLEGCSRSSYILTTIRELRKRGFACVALNFRSCDGSPNRRPRFYHSGETGDLKFVVRTLTERIGQPLTGVIGFSLGGNVLLKYLGETRERHPLQGAVTVSVPFDLGAGADALHRGLTRLYERYFLGQLKTKIQDKEKRYNHGYDTSKLPSIESLRDFDDAYTAPVHGFDSAEDYYRQSSSRHYLGGIETPTLVLHARNDPMVPEDSIPTDALEANENIIECLTDRGGHVGFVEGAHPVATRFWAEVSTADFLSTLRNPDRTGGQR